MAFKIHDWMVLFETKSPEELSAQAKQANRAFPRIGEFLTAVCIGQEAMRQRVVKGLFLSLRDGYLKQFC
jgi:hypothetical protein